MEFSAFIHCEMSYSETQKILDHHFETQRKKKNYTYLNKSQSVVVC